MKIAVTITREGEDDLYRTFCIKPETEDELYEAAQDVVSFINDSFDELKEEGY